MKNSIRRGLSTAACSLFFGATAQAAAIGVNFQLADPGDGGLPAGYLVDIGSTFGDRGNGYSYGWNANVNAQARNRVIGGQDANAGGDERRDGQPGTPGRRLGGRHGASLSRS